MERYNLAFVKCNRFLRDKWHLSKSDLANLHNDFKELLVLSQIHHAESAKEEFKIIIDMIQEILTIMSNGNYDVDLLKVQMIYVCEQGEKITFELTFDE